MQRKIAATQREISGGRDYTADMTYCFGLYRVRHGRTNSRWQRGIRGRRCGVAAWKSAWKSAREVGWRNCQLGKGYLQERSTYLHPVHARGFEGSPAPVPV
ncbi:uncharacterized protein TRAVEDRAFT_54826 [Trametes versicolor FP-101664 SS1]|uniref:Uncharacterized protein n=1 Tax=Trametes versicolor (strain FP-101664) TaxID=717944 RepID=R7S6K7_TRAVS|nr:uncharacterized protein TRAVEDRAFT_54826 [Trametes versicolor FP-101664 SS1]EIW51167.1 hypothetical protein TRAVEDRAFT_54826 [Trametes versicolor FP-101664 SS1]